MTTQIGASVFVDPSEITHSVIDGCPTITFGPYPTVNRVDVHLRNVAGIDAVIAELVALKQEMDPPAPCWCGHIARVHNVAGQGGGRGFCTECSPGGCGRYEVSRHPAPVTAGKCPAVSYWDAPCTQDPGHTMGHEDKDGGVWYDDEPAPVPCASTSPVIGGQCTRTGGHTRHGDDINVWDWDNEPASVTAPSGMQDPAPVARVITDSERTCPEQHPGSGAPCHRDGDHGVHRDPDGEEWRTDGAERGLASCGHPANEDGECDCSSWPERAVMAR